MSPEPIASYRLQLHEGFGFDHAAGICGYLHRLGISHLYLSPILQARSGSTHGYDVVDHERLNAQLGGAESYDRLVDAWSPGRIIVDIVPNHMAVTDPTNRWWWDVLKNGPSSRYAAFFDIDWEPSEDRLRRSILVPILGDHYGRVVEAGEIVVASERGEPVVRYYEHTLPLAPGTEPEDPAATSADADALHDVLEAQHYRLARWTAAGADLNYRRFFAINDLAALRIDRDEVFDAVHGFVLELVHAGAIHGLRIDHVDGLRYPTAYLERLSSLAPETPIWVEKILEGDEDLPTSWPVAGTTGYEFISRCSRLFIAPDGEKPLTDLYVTFTGIDTDPDELARDARFIMMNTELATDVERLTDLFVAVCEDLRRYRDFTRPELRQTVRETLASMPVYRTYVDSRAGEVREKDTVTVMEAIEDARERRPDLDPELFDLLRDVLLLKAPGEEEEALAMRFQQASGPVMAKGLEDTFFYRYNRFVALNEVGGDPTEWSSTVDAFHRANERAHEQWPYSLLTTSTHDTKRSEDVRARLWLLSEIPDRWGQAVERWAAINEHYKTGDLPDRNMEYLLYQTLVGAWPITTDRVVGFMTKAAKEAKEHTSWIAPNDAYDAALRSFVTEALADAGFMREVEDFVEPLVHPGRVNSLAQTLLKLTAPGIPDLYQGSEVWDLSLVDPDNRRPVDHAARTALLDDVVGMTTEHVWERADDGAPKMFVIERALRIRTDRPDAFGETGAYRSITASGARAENVVAFGRGEEIVVVVPRLVLSLESGWDDTRLELPSGGWRNVFTDDVVSGTLDMGALLASFPIALLVRT